MRILSILCLFLLAGVIHSQTFDADNTTQVRHSRTSRWNSRSIVYLSLIIICSLLIITGVIFTTMRGLREHRRLVSINEPASSDRDNSMQCMGGLTGGAEWTDQDISTIAKTWNSFSYDERIRFCQLFLLKMDQDSAPLFFQLFLEAFTSEVDRRMWYHLVDCFHLLYSMVFYNNELTERMNEAVTREVEKILLNIGKEEMKGDSKDWEYLRFACYDALILLQNKKTIKNVLSSFESKQFDYSTALRIAVWSCTTREDKDPSDLRFILKEKLQSEKKEEERKGDHEETGTRRQHLIYSIGATTDSAIYEYMYNKFVNEYQYSPSELVYLFKGGCAYPDTRKRVFEAFLKDKKLKSKISKDKEAHEKIISILSLTSLEEKDVKKLDEYVASTHEFGADYKKKFFIDELLTRANRFNTQSSVLHSNLIKFLDGREKKEKESH